MSNKFLNQSHESLCAALPQAEEEMAAGMGRVGQEKDFGGSALPGLAAPREEPR